MAIKEQRKSDCMSEAYQLAQSGKHLDYLTIENALSGRYPEAREWLDRDSIRDDLRRMCNKARQEGGDANRS